MSHSAVLTDVTAGGGIHIGNVINEGDAITAESVKFVVHQPSPLNAEERYELGLLADKVESQWITGYLNRSLHGTVLIEYRAQARDDLVDSPWSRTLEQPNREPRDLPPGVPLLEIFKDSGRALLIVGEPGAGKTITLLTLCRDLLIDAKTDSTNPVPVVLNLSSWTADRLQLGEWLVEELRVRYRVPTTTGRLWVEKRRLLPLLDGLDEVADDARALCVETIGQFETLCGIVVCCRRADYEALPVRLNFNAAISLHPFSPSQIEAYLVALGEGADGLREAIAKEPELRDLAANPLMLSIMSLAFQNNLLAAQRIAARTDRVAAIFNQYIGRMFGRRPEASTIYSEKLTIQWLTAVAVQMQVHRQSTLLVEQLQPTWLPHGAWRWIYVLITRLFTSAMVAAGCFFTDIKSLPSPTMSSLSAFLAVLAAFALPEIILLGFAVNDTRNRLNLSSWPVYNLRVLLTGVGLALYLAFEVGGGRIPSSLQLWLLSIFMGGAGAVAWCYAQPSHGGQSGSLLDVRTIQNLHWRLGPAFRGMLGFGICIFFLAFAMGGFVSWVWSFFEPFEGLSQTEKVHRFLASGLSVAWIWGLVGGIGGFIIAGFQGRVKGGVSHPNEGITSSLFYAIVAASAGLVIGLVSGLVLAEHDWMLIALLGYVAAVALALRYGGQAVVRHYTLRALLALRRDLPWRLVRFLEHARGLIFLQRAGGNYLFLHRLLLEHFARGKGGTPEDG